MPYEVQRLQVRHHEILRYKLAGYNNTEISEIVGCSRETVQAVVRSPLFVAELNRRMKEKNEEALDDEKDAFESKARMILRSNAEKAATVQVDLLESEDDSVRLRSSNSILDRALGKVSENGSGAMPNGVGVQISEKLASDLILALKESRHVENTSANCTSAESSEDEQGAICEASDERPRLGHRETEAQGDWQVSSLNGQNDKRTAPEVSPQPKGSSDGEHDSDQE